MSDADEKAFDVPLEKLGRAWQSKSTGFYTFFRLRRNRIIDAALKLRASHGLSAGDVSEIELNIPVYLAELPSSSAHEQDGSLVQLPLLRGRGA